MNKTTQIQCFIKLLLFLIFISVNFNAFGQVLIDTTLYYETANSGTVKRISNKEVCAIVFFISGPNTNWDLKNKNAILKRDKRGYKRLVKELAGFDIDYKVHLEIFNLNEDFKIDSIVNYKSSVAEDHYNTSNRYKKANGEKLWTHYSKSDISFFKDKEYLTYEGGYYFIMYHEGLGISSASPAILNGYEERTIPEYITLFEYDHNWRKNNKYVVNHEVLHLYGAWDLYQNPIYGIERSKYEQLKEAYPNSLMRISKKITIDPITAWRIGINENPEKWFLDLVPQMYKKSFINKGL